MADPTNPMSGGIPFTDGPTEPIGCKPGEHNFNETDSKLFLYCQNCGEIKPIFPGLFDQFVTFDQVAGHLDRILADHMKDNLQ